MSDVPAAGNWFLGWKPQGLLEWIADLRHGAPHGIRWFHPEDCHVTLAFFGRLPADKIHRVVEVLEASASQSIAATIGQPLLLPSARRFSSLSFLIESGPLRNAMAEQRDEWMGLAGLPPERRDPLPHLTFARPDRRASGAEIRAVRTWMEQLQPPNELEVTFEGPALFTWADDRTQRQFKVVLRAGEKSRPS